MSKAKITTETTAIREGGGTLLGDAAMAAMEPETDCYGTPVKQSTKKNLGIITK